MVTNVFKVLAEGNALVYLAQQSSFGIRLALCLKWEWEYMQRYSITIKKRHFMCGRTGENNLNGLLIVLKCIFKNEFICLLLCMSFFLVMPVYIKAYIIK